MWRLVLLVSLSPVGALAQSSLDDAARAAFQAGQEAYAAGEFEDALRAFVSGYELSGRPAFLYNIGNSHERLHSLEDALDFYQRYLRAVPDADNRSEVERRMQRIRDRLESDTDPLVVSEPSRAPAWAAFAIGGAGALTFAVSGGLALKSHNDLAECRPTSTCGSSERDEGKRRALVADVGLGLSLAGGIAGVVLWVLTNPHADDSVRVRPTLDRRNAGLQLQGTF